MSTRFGDAPAPAVTLDDHALARSLATRAGQVLLRVRAQLTAEGADQRTLKDAGDLAAQRELAALLAATRPRDAVLSEEARDDPSRLTAHRVWIIDPLDGTREFSEVGRDDWAVHVALWEDGDLVAGAVTRPAAGLAFGTPDPGRRPGRDGPLRLAVSRSRPPGFVTEVARLLDAELVPMGSAGVKATSLLLGRADVYLHAGGQYEWDSAAPVAVARAAGLHTSRVDGSPLRYNQADPYLPDLLICPPEVAGRVLGAVTAVSGLL